jgi:hypothetical protein
MSENLKVATPTRLDMGERLQAELVGVLSIFGYGTDTAEHWLRRDATTVWLCIMEGRVGIGVSRRLEGDRFELRRAGPNSPDFPSGRPLPLFGYTVVYSDGTMASDLKYLYASKAAEATISVAAGNFQKLIGVK